MHVCVCVALCKCRRARLASRKSLLEALTAKKSGGSQQPTRSRTNRCAVKCRSRGQHCIVSSRCPIAAVFTAVATLLFAKLPPFTSSRHPSNSSFYTHHLAVLSHNISYFNTTTQKPDKFVSVSLHRTELLSPPPDLRMFQLCPPVLDPALQHLRYYAVSETPEGG